MWGLERGEEKLMCRAQNELKKKKDLRKQEIIRRSSERLPLSRGGFPYTYLRPEKPSKVEEPKNPSYEHPLEVHGPERLFEHLALPEEKPGG